MEKFEDVGGKEESIIVTYATRKEAEQVLLNHSKGTF